MPAVMIRSWARATSAPTAIFGSNRNEMYALTRSRNTIRATNALWEIVPPHVGPTSVSLISLVPIRAAVASAWRSRSAFCVIGWATGGKGDEEMLTVGVGAALGDGDPEAEAVGVGPAVGLA